MNPIACSMLIEIDYHDIDDPLADPIRMIFARDAVGLHFLGAYFEVIRDDDRCFTVRIPFAADELPEDAMSIALSFAWSICNRFDDEPVTLRDPPKGEA
jgi:hypothetical protein